MPGIPARIRLPCSAALRLGFRRLLATLKAVVAAPPTYTVAYRPQFSAPQTIAEWQPPLKRVGDEAGVKLECFLSTSPGLRDVPSCRASRISFCNHLRSWPGGSRVTSSSVIESVSPASLVVAKDGPVVGLAHLAGQIASWRLNAGVLPSYARAAHREQLRIELSEIPITRLQKEDLRLVVNDLIDLFPV